MFDEVEGFALLVWRYGFAFGLSMLFFVGSASSGCSREAPSFEVVVYAMLFELLEGEREAGSLAILAAEVRRRFDWCWWCIWVRWVGDLMVVFLRVVDFVREIMVFVGAVVVVAEACVAGCREVERGEEIEIVMYCLRFEVEEGFGWVLLRLVAKGVGPGHGEIAAVVLKAGGSGEDLDSACTSAAEESDSDGSAVGAVAAALRVDQ